MKLYEIIEPRLLEKRGYNPLNLPSGSGPDDVRPPVAWTICISPNLYRAERIQPTWFLDVPALLLSSELLVKVESSLVWMCRTRSK